MLHFKAAFHSLITLHTTVRTGSFDGSYFQAHPQQSQITDLYQTATVQPHIPGYYLKETRTPDSDFSGNYSVPVLIHH